MSSGLYGIDQCSRDFGDAGNWGKNIFNNSFPVALACYMSDKGIPAVYLKLEQTSAGLAVVQTPIPIAEMFGSSADASEFLFEEVHAPYKSMSSENIDCMDVVVAEQASGTHVRPLEIKLTVVPDNSTCDKPRDQQCTELVVRRPPIAYLALSLAERFVGRESDLLGLLNLGNVSYLNWTSAADVAPKLPSFVAALDRVLCDDLVAQRPLIMQPIWRTAGKSLVLDDECLDIFVWSDYAFTRLFVDPVREAAASGSLSTTSIDRIGRTLVWLVKMLWDFGTSGDMSPYKTTNDYTYGTKNDKAFSVTGARLIRYLASPELTHPRISKAEISQIILGGGHKHLSPERRFDAAVQADDELFI